MAVVFLEEMFINNPLAVYDHYPNFDVFMHILGGFVTVWSSYLFLSYLKKYKKIIIRPLSIFCFTLIGSTAIVGILWEVYEFCMHALTGLVTQPSVADTVADLGNDLIGAVLFCGILLLLNKNKKI